ncbi:MAG TPA: hypothetical protein VKR83_06730 [Ktedonobacteraceae bacterium]|nr:hypothetical protein [Ktedonobacteraceae bacterium]
MATPIEEINKLVERLSPDQQRRVLEYAQNLAQRDRPVRSLPTTPLPPGTPGTALLATLQGIKLLPEDIDAMERALEDCERIEPDEY